MKDIIQKNLDIPSGAIYIEGRRIVPAILFLLFIAASFICGAGVFIYLPLVGNFYDIFLLALLIFFFILSGTKAFKFIKLALRNKEVPALTATKYGITDNTGIVNIGMIDWEDIMSIEIMPIRRIGIKVLKVYTKNDKKYTDRISFLPAKWYVKSLNFFYAPAVSVSECSIKIKAEELHKIFLEKRGEYLDLV